MAAAVNPRIWLVASAWTWLVANIAICVPCIALISVVLSAFSCVCVSD